MIGRRHILILAVLFSISLCSCNRNGEKKVIDKAYDDSAEADRIDILKYKVKLESFKKDSLSLDFKHIYLKRIGKNDFELNAKVDFPEKALEYNEGYYIVFSIYPLDDEIDLLRKDSQKFKFETFSTKIQKNGLDELVISRKINTKLKFARAITISVIAYDTKQKSSEVVLQNVNFLKQLSVE